MHLFPELFAATASRRSGSIRTMLRGRWRRRARRPRRRADGRGADARHLQFGLFRALLPRRPDGRRAVEGQDLFVEDGYLYMRTTQGRERVDVVYRRIDDAFLDPLTFRPDSTLGVPGLFDLYRAGRVTHRQRAGRRHRRRQGGLHLRAGDHPVLHRPAADPAERADLALRRSRRARHVLEHLAELVVKEVHGSGGYGMLVGPTADQGEIEVFREKIKARPGELHRPADAGALDLPPSSRPASRRATSISAPMCWSATACASCPAG